MRILLVDDNLINLFTLEKLLRNSGYNDCIPLNSTKDLLVYMQTPANARNVDLILLDIMMPEIDGLEACRQIKQMEHAKNVQIIFVTALEDKKKLVEALDTGGSDYISKPLNKTELLARIRVALRLKKELDWHTEHDKKIQIELKLASKVQQNLLSAPFENDDLKIDVSYCPSSNLSGDLYYWYQLDENRYAIILLDMMGHGISSSLICMYISSVLRETINNIVEPVAVMTELNRYMSILHNELGNGIPYYFTGIYLVIDTQEKTIEYINAGHPAGYITLDEKDIQPLSSNTMAVGFFDTLCAVKEKIYYEDTFQIVLFTDGVLEALDEDESIAEQKIRERCSNHWVCPNAVIDELLPPAKQLHQPDDMCVILIQGQKNQVETDENYIAPKDLARKEAREVHSPQ